MSNGPKVLVVDDDENILSAFEDFFKKEHCSMIAAPTAEDALQLLKHHRVDLMITDIRLPSRSGVTLFLDAKIIHPHLSVIVITGHPDVVSEKELRAYGVDYFFLKPLELDKLRDTVRTCLGLTNR